jgi:tetratricopeptide (TPR) repeat protein
MASKVKKKATSKISSPAPSLVVASPVRSWLWAKLFAAALLLAAVVYLPALNGPVIFDDYHLPFSDLNAARMSARFWIGGVRPVLMASYWFNYAISGTRTFSYHAVNLLIHAASTVVVFYVLQRLLKLASIEKNALLFSLFGAGIFLLHPLQSESAAYIAGRSELVSGLLLVTAWLVFLNHFESQTTGPTALKILLLAAAAVLGKESAISLPALLLVTDFYWNRASLRDQLRSRWKLYVPIVVGGLVAAVAIIRSLDKAPSAGLSLENVTPLRYALTQCRVIFIYLRLFLIPAGQSGDWRIPFYRSFTDGTAWLYVFGILILFGGIVLLYRRAPLLSFGLLVFVLLLLPTSSLIPIKDALAERRMYIAIVGLILAVIAILNRYQLDPAVLKFGAIAVLSIAAIVTFQRSQVWGDDVAFWQDVLAKDPGNKRAHDDLENAYMRHGRFTEAMAENDLLDKTDGVTERTLLNRVAVYEVMQNYDLALDTLQKTAAMHPTSSTYTEIGHLEAYLGHIPESLAAFGLALKLDPKYAPAHAQRGMIYLATGDNVRASSDFHEALHSEPNNEIATSGLAKLAANH